MRIVPLKIESIREAERIVRDLGVSEEAVKILSPKEVFVAFKIEGINSWEANIIKQHLLSLGSDSATEKDALVKKIKTDTIIFGNLSQLKKLCQKLKDQPFSLKRIASLLSSYLDNVFKREFIFKARDKSLRIKGPIICGIINLTTDSFSGDGLLSQAELTSFKFKYLLLKRVEEMAKYGAKMIDLGAESSRPFSKPIKEKEELKRVITALKIIRKKFKKILISIDTYKYKVAKESLEYGADIINDITALRKSPSISSLIKKYRAGIVLMHMKGTPQVMQINPRYKEGVIEEIVDFFKERLNYCQKKAIAREQILIDPGIGFGKSLQDNLCIISQLYKFKFFGLPILIGISRKSFIGKLLDLKVEERLIGSLSANLCALFRGANVLRVHDVRETHQAVKIFSHLFYS
ncbi:MAG TPA: dihydropteroate synthase [Candidatus Omnitrophica bacterium]|nr:dihydropteroate synthase [Candidatus Omnitrophota bacterium]